MFAVLAHFFKGRDAVGIVYKEHMPEGICGTQVPDAMVALTATAVGAHPSDHRLPALIHLMKRFSGHSMNALREDLHHSQRQSAVRGTGATSTPSKL